MECCANSSGAAERENGNISQQARDFEIFLRDLEKDYSWSILCVAGIHSVKWRSGFKTSEGHKAFVYASMQEAAAFGHLVSAEVLVPVKVDSFRVRRRNCSLGICWEGKKFRVICSHLLLTSVSHENAKDLVDLGALTNAREEDSAVHICVDAQTGLGTTPPRPFRENIGMAMGVLHRAGKRRLLKNFIMENMLTATNTYDTEIVGIKRNIYTCSFNGRHEPQQIDYILPPDRCLRLKTFDSPATTSGHWGLTTTIRSPHAKETHRKTRRKPIGWQCHDRYNYNNDVTVLGFMAIVGMAQQLGQEDP